MTVADIALDCPRAADSCLTNVSPPVAASEYFCFDLVRSPRGQSHRNHFCSCFKWQCFAHLIAPLIASTMTFDFFFKVIVVLPAFCNMQNAFCVIDFFVDVPVCRIHHPSSAVVGKWLNFKKINFPCRLTVGSHLFLFCFADPMLQLSCSLSYLK